MPTIIVNFYTRTYGDTVANMLAGHHVIRCESSGSIINELPDQLKYPSFYSPAQLEFQHTWYERAKKKSNILPAHRQYGFDFARFDKSATVISIIPDLVDVVARRTLAIDTWREEHPILSKFIRKLTDNEQIKYTKKTIEIWAEKNILDDDIKIPLSDLTQLKHLNLGLEYNQNVIDGIYIDMEKYAS
jgi:hypothetical protein